MFSYLVATTVAIVAALIGLLWFFAGSLLFKRLGIDSDPVGLMMGRRIGAIYLGICIILFLSRNALPSDVRSSVCIGLAFSLTCWHFLVR